MIILSFSMLGHLQALKLKNEALLIEESIMLINYISDRLRFMRSGVYSLFESAVKSGRFNRLEYLTECFSLMKKDIPFSESLIKALDKCRNKKNEEVYLILADLSGIGRSDIESQINLLAYVSSRLENKLLQKEEEVKKYSKMYKTLGVLSGFAVAIFLM